jgi:hypothetical protein
LNILGKVKTGEVLCASCVHEVTQKGFKGEKLTFCGYGGGLRELKFEVCECTAYRDKSVPEPEKPIGFIKPGEKARPRLTVIKIA